VPGCIGVRGRAASASLNPDRVFSQFERWIDEVLQARCDGEILSELETPERLDGCVLVQSL